MNTSQVSGILKNIVGRFQERIGKFFDDEEQQVTGRQKQSIGKAEKNLGDARELIKNAFKQMQRSKQAIHIRTAGKVTNINQDQDFSARADKLTYPRRLN